MNQIWFGLVWINPKESKTQRNKKKQQNKNMFSRLVWTSLDPSSPHFFLLFLFFWFWVMNHSRPYFHYKRLVHGQQKANMVLDNVMYLGK